MEGTMNPSESAMAGILEAQKGLQIIFRTMVISQYLFSKQALVKDGEEFDFVIAGGGTAGCVLAYRLAQANFTVALLEAGDDPPIQTFFPRFLEYVLNNDVDWNYKAVEDNFTRRCHRDPRINLNLGKCLGGSSTIGHMHAFRGSHRDYHKWAVATNDSSWEAENLQPYFKRSLQLFDNTTSGSKSSKNNMYSIEFNHAKGFGEAIIGMTRDGTPKTANLLESFKELGNKILSDFDAFEDLGYRPDIYTFVDGIRQNTANKYLVPARIFPNLVVVKNILVAKVMFNKNKFATGVEAILNGKKIILKAKKEVIVSAGAVKSPQLLKLSGIGPTKHLREKSVTPISDLPVGYNFRSTIGVIIFHKTEKLKEDPPLLDFHNYPTPTVVGFRSLKKCSKKPDYGTYTYVQNSRDNFMRYCAFIYNFNHTLCNKLYYMLRKRELAYTVIYNVYPKSHGRVLLKNFDPQEPPLVYSGHFTDPRDMELQIKSIRDFVSIVNTTYFKENGASRLDPSNQCAQHHYDSDDYWRCYSLCFTVNIWNYIGTCAMGAVVDSKLRVLGVHRLRVVDASVIPSPVAGGTYLPTVILAEKASDMIKDDYKK